MNAAHIVRTTMQTLHSMGHKEFEQLFGKSMGNHLWEKYVHYERDVSSFICSLDDINLTLLINNGLSDSPIIERFFGGAK